MKPGEEAATFHGTETVRSLGGFWILAEGEGEMGGTISRSVMTLGFDPPTNRFVGTWIGSMMPKLWIYDGEMNAGETLLSLYAEGPGWDDQGTIAKFRDDLEIRSADHKVFTSHSQDSAGKWIQIMEAHYRRRP